jgi:hypothetical protein
MIPTAKEMANRLVTRNHNLIQDIGGDLGKEILVSILAKKLALITVDEVLNVLFDHGTNEEYSYWLDAEKELKEL